MAARYPAEALQPSGFIQDFGGRIETIVLCVPRICLLKLSGMADRMLSALGSLLLSLPTEVVALLIIDKSSGILANRWLEELAPVVQVRLVEAAETKLEGHSIWIQDTFHVRDCSQNLQIGRSGSDNHALHACTLSTHFGLSTETLNVHMSGGNQLVGDDFRLVGHNSLRQTAERRDVGSLNKAFAYIQALDPRKLCLFGFHTDDRGNADSEPGKDWDAPWGTSFHQHGFHLDQFVSLTGIRNKDRPVIMVAEPVAVDRGAEATAKQAGNRLNSCVSWLQAHGFNVIRNPVPYATDKMRGSVNHHLYNNVILENEPRTRAANPLIWLPVMKAADTLGTEFDRENHAIWKRLGFSVVEVRGWTDLAKQHGSIRCATKVLRRSSSTF